VRYGGFSVPHNVADAIMEERGRAHSRRRTDQAQRRPRGEKPGSGATDRSVAREIHDEGEKGERMRGAILPGDERVEIREFPVPEPGHGQVLIRMKASGLCGSDLRAIYHEHKGPGAERCQNVIACLEPTGQLEAVGPGVSNFEAQGEGGSVTFEPNPLLLHKQLTLHGLWVCGIFEMGQLLEHLARKQLHPEATMTPSFPLSETKQAYETFDAGKTGKVVISWEDE